MYNHFPLTIDVCGCEVVLSLFTCPSMFLFDDIILAPYLKWEHALFFIISLNWWNSVHYILLNIVFLLLFCTFLWLQFSLCMYCNSLFVSKNPSVKHFQIRVCCYAVLRNKNYKHTMLCQICKGNQIITCCMKNPNKKQMSFKKRKKRITMSCQSQSMLFSFETQGGSSTITISDLFVITRLITPCCKSKRQTDQPGLTFKTWSVLLWFKCW